MSFSGKRADDGRLNDGAAGGQLLHGLPYVDNLPLTALTVAVNLLCMFLFFYGKKSDLGDVITDSLICGVITSFIDVFFVASRLKALAVRGELPSVMPVSRLMMRLPANRFFLSLVFALFFGVLTALVNLAFVKFYGITDFDFIRLLVWKVIYSCVLSAKVAELAVLRFVQQDIHWTDSAGQSGTDIVKNPLPRFSAFKEYSSTVAHDFGFNMIAGLFFGSTVVEGARVVIMPVHSSSIAVTSVVLGAIVVVYMVYPVAKSVRAALCASYAEPEQTNGGVLSILPYAPWKFALSLALPVIVLSFCFFWSVMTFFGFETLNFFQFFLIRALFVSLLSKAVVKLATARYIQCG